MSGSDQHMKTPAPALPGVGVGLKPQHFHDIVDQDKVVDWFEVHPENYMFEGGPSHRWLNRIRQDYPLSLHSVGLSSRSTTSSWRV